MGCPLVLPLLLLQLLLLLLLQSAAEAPAARQQYTPAESTAKLLHNITASEEAGVCVDMTAASLQVLLLLMNECM